MPNLKTYNLFFDHAWRYSTDYYQLEQLLKDAPHFIAQFGDITKVARTFSLALYYPKSSIKN